MKLAGVQLKHFCVFLFPYATVNSYYNQVGYNVLSGCNEVVFGPCVALSMETTSFITKTNQGPEDFVKTRVHCIIQTGQAHTQTHTYEHLFIFHL